MIIRSQYEDPYTNQSGFNGMSCQGFVSGGSPVHVLLIRKIRRSQGRMVCCMLFVVTVLGDLSLGEPVSGGRPGWQ